MHFYFYNQEIIMTYGKELAELVAKEPGYTKQVGELLVFKRLIALFIFFSLINNAFLFFTDSKNT